VSEADFISSLRERLVEVRKLIAKVEAPNVVVAPEDVASLREEERLLMELIAMHDAGV
jgi:hypothetical protein